MNKKFLTVVALVLSLIVGVATAMETPATNLLESATSGTIPMTPSWSAKAKPVIPGLIGMALVADGLDGFLKGALGNYFARFLKKVPKTEWLRKKIENRSAEYQKAAQISPRAHYVKQTLKLAAGALACWYAYHVYNTGGFFGGVIGSSQVDAEKLLQELIIPPTDCFSKAMQPSENGVVKNGIFTFETADFAVVLHQNYLNSLNFSQALLQMIKSDKKSKANIVDRIVQSILSCEDLKKSSDFLYSVPKEILGKIVSAHPSGKDLEFREGFKKMMFMKTMVNETKYPLLLVEYIKTIVSEFVEQKVSAVSWWGCLIDAIFEP